METTIERVKEALAFTLVVMSCAILLWGVIVCIWYSSDAIWHHNIPCWIDPFMAIYV